MKKLLIGLSISLTLIGLSRCSASPESTEDSRIVYTAGSYNNGLRQIPCYWAGTVRTDLAGDGTHSATAMCVYVSGGTVYTSGHYGDGSKQIPCFWTGTTRTDLPGDGTHDSFAESIFVSAGTVYISGFYSNGSGYIYPVLLGGNHEDGPSRRRRSPLNQCIRGNGLHGGVLCRRPEDHPLLLDWHHEDGS